MNMDLNDIRSLITLGGFVLFVALMAWTYRPARRAAHEAAARLPFDGEAPATPKAPQAQNPGATP